MAITALMPTAGHMQVYSGGAAPVNPPANPALPAIYYELDAGGQVLSTYYWDSVAGWSQLPAVVAGSNWSEGLVCGWEGPHNAAHLSPAHAEVAFASVLTPRFSCAVVSGSPIPFEMLDTSTGAPVVIATGTFPAGAKFADAAACSLVDTAAAPVTAFGFAPTVAMPVAHYAVVPTGGHAAAPADGEGFYTHWRQVYA